MRKVLSGLLVAAALGAGAGPAVAYEPADCGYGDIQAGCRYCSYNNGNGLNAWSHCKNNEPGYSAKLCLFWNATRCEAYV